MSTHAAAAAPAPSAHVSVDRPNMTQVGTIVWLSSELMFFAGLFAIYFTHRAVAGPEVWAESTSKLNMTMVIINTAILVSSSVTCQYGVWAAEALKPRRSGSLLNVRQWGMVEWYTLTFILGSVFIAGQIVEYAELVEHGISIAGSSYGSVFYLTTGFHGLHVIGGLIAFLFVLGSAFVAGRFTHREATRAVVTSYYWHFVDVVWIALFFAIYFLK
ncbi:cytochrome c oxidase subunit 3 [Salana multivorans]|uniref:cytochrome-c oxidase n=2 Tax=Salana multivorans TaxID=120377 RepID=A0A3N2D1S0_9MICO|nr:cytochrome c oxidase subunit 3 [Salana multivorans]